MPTTRIAAAARAALIAAAPAGLATAMPLCIPSAVLIGAAAVVFGNRPAATGLDSGTP